AVQPEADPANTDPADTWLFESDGVLEERVFICQNWRADAALVVDSSGAAVQRAWYTAYGVPTGADRADLNGDGVVDSSDASVFSAWHGASDIRAAWNLDGTVNSTDTIAYLNAYNSAATLGGRGVLSSAALDLRVGYAGYRWEAFTERYHVRHRVYEPYMGRWQNRDPIEYFGDSYNLYEYVGSRPTVWRDPLGLQVTPQPVVPRDDRPHRAPYDIFPGESIESIIKKQRDAIQDMGKETTLSTSVEQMDCCFRLGQGTNDASSGLFKDDWDGLLREAKDGATNIAMEYATAGLLCAGFGAADDIAKLCQNLVKKNNNRNRVTLPDGRIVDLQGKPHNNKQGCGSVVPTPHVKTPDQRLHPDKKTRRDVRPATPEDLRDVEDYLDKRNKIKR
ncbi:MAG: hypothetical protein KIS87_11965, partial [Phycisphaeraceae bacterium]|nr:hypothetical protein [Phycisphaeraceae bacterium]